MNFKTGLVGIPGQRKGILDSRNFFVSILTLILLPFVDNGLDVEAAIAAESVVDALLGGDLTTILAVLLPNIVQPFMKWIQNGISGWSWGFLKSWNFWTQAITAVLVVATAYGLVFPDEAVTDVSDAIQSGQFDLITVAIVINVINPVYHFLKTLLGNKE